MSCITRASRCCAGSESAVADAPGSHFEDVAENLKVEGHVPAFGDNWSPGPFERKRHWGVEKFSCEGLLERDCFFGVHESVGRCIPDPVLGL